MQRRDSDDITFDGTLMDCTVCAVGKSDQLAHPESANNAGIKAPFQLVHGDLMGVFATATHGGYKYVSNITDQPSRWPAVYLLCSKDQVIASLPAYIASTVIPSAIELSGFTPTGVVNTSAKLSTLTAWKRVYKQNCRY